MFCVKLLRGVANSVFDEFAVRRAAWTPPAQPYLRGYGLLYQQQVTQADQGCDFALLAGNAPTPEPSIY